ncbi:hypothetical protein [uncultured Cetobacterium sp.]|uniref:hypothetical protein n=2 Tax=uncultured Cetobacterium sp. TaxID=527638 RepID=UPI002621F241|nr:hypothetical protein [uncultured Cetobacterium sp.]
MIKKTYSFILIFIYSFLYSISFSKDIFIHSKLPLVYISYEYHKENSVLLFFKILNLDNQNTYSFNFTNNLIHNFNIIENKSFWIPSHSKVKKNITFHNNKTGSSDNNMIFNIVDQSLFLKIKNKSQGGLLVLSLEPKIFTIESSTSLVYVNNSSNMNSKINNELTKLTLHKYQAIDKNRDNIPDTPFSKNTIATDLGDIVFYKLIAINEGETTVTNLYIQDSIPEYTSLSSGDNSISERGKPSWKLNNGAFNEILSRPNFGESGILSTNVSTLNSGETITIYYNIKINN